MNELVFGILAIIIIIIVVIMIYFLTKTTSSGSGKPCNVDEQCPQGEICKKSGSGVVGSIIGVCVKK